MKICYLICKNNYIIHNVHYTFGKFSNLLCNMYIFYSIALFPSYFCCCLYLSALVCSQWVGSPDAFGLTESASVTESLPSDSPLLSDGVRTVADLMDRLSAMYCEGITVEVAHMMVGCDSGYSCFDSRKRLSLNFRIGHLPTLYISRYCIFDSIFLMTNIVRKCIYSVLRV